MAFFLLVGNVAHAQLAATLFVDQDVTCNGGTDGIIRLTASGGPVPYSYAWSDGATSDQNTPDGTAAPDGSTFSLFGSTRTGVAAGVYSVTVTDNAAGTATAMAVTVTQPGAVSLDAIVGTNLLCNGDGSGSIATTVSGGTPPYSYTWTGGAAGANPSGLAAGTYNVTVTDANNCPAATGSVTLTEPAAISSSVVSTTNQTEPCLNDGTIDISVSGGAGGFTFAWSNGATTEDVMMLAPGAYNVDITDANGCVQSINGINITAADPIVITLNTQTDVDCAGDATGALDITASGGVGGYTYAWDNGLSAGPTHSGLAAGDYNVTVTSGSCSETAMYTITEPANGLMVGQDAANTADIDCNGGTASAGVTVSGGTSPYTYTWSGGLSNGPTHTGLAQGVYSLTVTDNAGCDAVLSPAFTFTEPAALTAGVQTVVDAVCNGEAGSVTITASGGTAPLVWGEPLLAPGSANTIVGGTFTVTATAGTYSFQVQDDNGCGPVTVNVTITEPDAITATATTTNITCNGAADGAIDQTVSGGAGGYLYAWASSNTAFVDPGTEDLAALEAGSYDVTITDANGCTEFYSYNVFEPTTLNVSASQTDILCAGASNGSIDLTVTDGTPPYTITWSNGASTEDISGLAAGTYGVTVDDNNGCGPVSASYTITEPAALTVFATGGGMDVSCNGGNDGAIDLNVSGGTPPYSYMWNTGASTEDLSGLTAGVYNVVVSDDNGCMQPLAVSISEPAAITAIGGATDISCNGAGDGSISITVSGGTMPYAYAWDNGLSAGTSHSGLAAGTYNLTVTDGNACTENFSYTVVEPAAITVNVTPGSPACPGDFASATASVSGGTAPFSYLWSTGGIAATETGLLAAGSPYSVTVTDANGCTGVGSVTIVDPSPVTVSVTGTDISCNGAADGSAVASASGGAGGYTYTWSNAATGANISGLTAGVYTVTAMDANGCSSSESVTITEPAALTVMVNSVTDPLCFGENGTVVLDVSGGTQFTGAPGEPANPNGYPYIYTWTGGATTINDHIADGVPAGNYTVDVSDARGCMATVTVSVGQPDLLVATASGTNPTCGGASDGTATVTVAGGTMPYTYAWSNGMMTQAIAGLAAGPYTVTVTDANGCTATDMVTLVDPAVLAIASADVKNSCNPGADGAVTLSISGGTAPYTYMWSDGQTTNPATGLAAGSYSVTVNDANGCGPVTASYMITQPSAPLEVANFNRTDVTCAGGMDGEIDNGGTTGGTPPYSYNWSNGATTPDIANLGAGNYSVTVTDAVGCTVVYLNIIINEPAAITVVNDPANNLDLNCNGDTDAFISVTASGGTGTLSYSWSNGVNGQSISGVPGGVYTVDVTDANGCVESFSYTVTEPAAITATSSTTDPSCASGNGGINVTISGGTPNYSYVWSNGATGATTGPIMLAAGNGTYGLTVTDANGCVYTDSYTLTAPAAIDIAETVTPTSCNSTSGTYTPDGSVSVVVTGGTAPYVYSWNGGATTTSSSISGLAAGAVVTVDVTDANGCTAQETYNVGEAPAVTSVANIVNNSACAKGTAGEIHITASGGTGALTYAWEGPNGPVAGTTDLLNLVSGNYTVTITDANGCEFDFNYFVADGTDPATLALTLGDVTCNGANDGSITIAVTSGTGPYIVVTTDGSGSTVDSTFLTAPFNLIQLNNLSPDTYSIAVIDQNGCPAAGATASITEPTKLVTSVVSTSDASCFGLADGSFTFSIDQGTQPYDMIWSDGTTAGSGMLTGLSDNSIIGTAWVGTISGLAAGTYDITVTDANGCEETDQAVIGQPSDLTITFTGKDDIDCYGDMTGSAVANISGGSGVYSYQWYAGQYPGPITPLVGQSGMVVNGMANAVNLGVGFYTIEVDDLVGGCTYYAVFEETGPAPIVVDLVHDASVTCNGGTDATASVTISGGVAPYAWVVSGATNASGSIPTDGGTNTFTGLGAGVYYVDVTDANGCVVPQASFTITEPAGLTVVTSADSILCPGGFNATANVVSVTGGIPPYSYLWSTGGTGMSTGVNVDGNPLFAGTYTVAVTDATGLCATTVSVDVYEPMPVGGTAVVTDVACAGDCSTSLIDLTPTGGTAPYTYYWRASVNGVPTGPVLSTVQDPAGLCAGEYTVRINDKYGCEGFATFTIGTATTLVVSGTETDVLCKGDATGAVDLTVAGGTSPYTYAWSNGSTTEDISGLAAGSYSVVVTDANGCSSAAAFLITEPFSSLYASVIGFTHVSCNGGSDGTADIYVVGGTLPYSYMWSNGSMVQDPTNLMAGVNSVTITDANGCQEFLSVTITEPAAALASGVESVTNIGCNGSTTGAIDISVSGGTSPYTYAWTSDDPGFSASSQDLSGIPAGVYAVAITDANGCTDGISGITVTQATGLTAVASATNVNCFGDATGSVSVTVSGGTMPYSYLWSDGSTTASINNLVSGGSYTVDVTDANGCMVTSNTVTVTGPTSPLAASLVSVQDVYTCFGDNTGFIDISVTGGTTPYSFAWSNGATVQNPQDLFAGGYQVTVTDANGCQTFIKGLVVNQPSQLLATVAKSTDVDCNGATTGSIDLAPAGGTAPYTFMWSNGAMTEDLSNLGAGTYSVTVTDANGCTATNSVVITEPAMLAVTIDATTNPSCNSGMDGMIMSTITGGTMPFTITWSDGVTGIEDRTGLAAGVYIINVTDACGATVSASTTLTEPSLLTATTVATDVDCFGANNGAIDVTVAGGTMPYQYNWGGGITSEDRTNLAPGTYTVIITDANGCSTTASAVVNGPASPISVSAVVTDVLCFGDATGAIDITVTGGTPPYSFMWSNGDNTEDLSNIPAGSYTGTVTDAAGCTFSATVTVAGPASALAASAVTTDVLCNGASTGMIDLTVTGGTAPYTYNWSNGANTQDLMNVPAGSYTGTVTDANGCVISATITITEPATGITVSNAVVTNVSCNGGTDGAVDITVTGGTPPYSYAWSNGAISQDLSSVPAGIYSGVITDANGCTFTASVTVGQPAALVATTTATNVNCFGDATGTVDLTVTGGTAPYSYAWSNGANTEDLLNVVAGSYNVVITDANGCVVNASATITQNSAIATSIVQSNVNCFGGSDGSASLNVSGGTPPYTIAWNTGDNTQNINNLSAGTYSVVVTDANGCTANNSVNISEPTELIVTAVYDSTISATSAVANVTGGTAPYSYQWNSVPAQFTQTAVGLSNGTYSVVVTDANGCSSVASVVVDGSPLPSIGIEEPALSEMINMYPNPTSDVVFVGYEFSSEQNLEINVVNGLGQVVMSATEANALNGKVRLDVADLANGVYYVVISNGTDSDNRRLVIQK